MKVIYISITVFLLLVIGYLYFKFYDINHKIVILANINEEINNEISSNRINNVIELEYLKLAIEYTDAPVKNQLIFFGTDSINKYFLNELVKTPKLFFHYSINDCTPCINRAFELISQVFPDYTENDNIILSGDYSMRLRNDCYGKKMICPFTFLLSDLGYPFFFLLDEDMAVKYLHIFNNNDTNSTLIYLNEMKKKFWDD